MMVIVKFTPHATVAPLTVSVRYHLEVWF